MDLNPCPLCGSKASIFTESLDERSGYGVRCIHKCSACHLELTTCNNTDENGWCNESRESVIARGSEKWNTRHILA